MNGRRAIRALALTLALGSAGAARPDLAEAQIFGPTPAPTTRPSTVVGRMGLVMSESGARHGIAFEPFMPPRQMIAVALLPPFHGEDVRANRGIAFEYDAAGHRYALAEWPANGGNVRRFPPPASENDSCPSARSFPRGAEPSGIVWSTARGLIMTLQADGKNDARTLESEWNKLVRRGACRH